MLGLDELPEAITPVVWLKPENALLVLQGELRQPPQRQRWARSMGLGGPLRCHRD